MRTADQIKRKLHELSSQKQSLETSLTQTDDAAVIRQTQEVINRVEEQVLLLEWVLNEPFGKYHA